MGITIHDTITKIGFKYLECEARVLLPGVMPMNGATAKIYDLTLTTHGIQGTIS